MECAACRLPPVLCSVRVGGVSGSAWHWVVLIRVVQCGGRLKGQPFSCPSRLPLRTFDRSEFAVFLLRFAALLGVPFNEVADQLVALARVPDKFSPEDAETAAGIEQGDAVEKVWHAKFAVEGLRLFRYQMLSALLGGRALLG
jgi:hypothetical protein